jgi:hypothetical protein
MERQCSKSTFRLHFSLLFHLVDRRLGNAMHRSLGFCSRGHTHLD